MIARHSPVIVLGVNAGSSAVNSAIGPVTRSPRSLIATTCSSAASTTVTSCPPRARYAPIVPPMAPAPHIRNLIPMSSGVAPVARQQRASLVDSDPPQGEHLVVGSLVHSAVIPVAQIRPQRDRIE